MSLGVDSMHTVAAVCLMLGARVVAGDSTPHSTAASERVLLIVTVAIFD